MVSTSTGGLWSSGAAHATDGTVALGDLTAPNIVGDSNVSSSLEGPDAFMIASEYCNTNSHVIYDVTTNVGTWGGTPSTSTAGEFEDTVVSSGPYTGTFDLDMIPGLGNPETRLIGELAAGECIIINSIVSYDVVDASGNPVWGRSNSDTDDLVYNFDYWATWSDPGPDTVVGTADDIGGFSAASTEAVTVRNEITASPNKIETSTVGVSPGTTVGVGETVTVTYDGVTFGSVNQGFDADGDGNPDYDVWFQAIGESNLWDPDVFQLVGIEATLLGSQCGGGRPAVTLTASDTTYFSGLDAYGNCNWKGTYSYTLIALSVGSSTVAPYQEAASGSNNEKYNGDYCGDDPASSPAYCITLTATGASGSIDKSVSPADANVGETVTWSLGVTNTSTVPLGDPGSGFGVWVNDSIPAGMTYIGGSAACGTLPCQIFYSTDAGVAFSAAEPATPGLVTDLRWIIDAPVPASATDTVTFGTSADTGTSGLVDNQAEVSIGDTPQPFDTATATTCIGGCPDLAIDKDTSTANVAPGGEATYSITVENLSSASGNATALGVSDVLPPGFTYASTTSIMPGNTDGTDPVRTSAINPTVGEANPAWGGWTLNPGDSVTVTFVADVALSVLSGTYDNTASATSSNASVTDDGTLDNDGGFTGGADPENDEDVTVLTPLLTIDKDTTTPSLAPGATATYTITVANSGLGTATGVTVADTFPVGWTFVSSTIAESGATRTATSNPAVGSASGTWGTWDIAAGGSVDITVDVLIPLAAADGVYDNTASANATNHAAIDDDGAIAEDADTPTGSDPENDEDVTVLTAPTLTATKTDAVALTASVNAGGTVTYTVEVANTSAVDATNVVFSDTPDADTTLTVGSVTTTSGTVTLGNAAGETAVRVDIGPLAAGTSVTISFEVSIDVPFPIGDTQIANQGAVTADLIPAIPTDDPETGSTPGDATITNVVAAPVLSVTKTDSPDPVEPGADITYSITYQNTGNQDATTVLLTETVPANTTFNATGSSGWTCAPDNNAGSSCSLSVGTLAPGAANAGTATFIVTIADTLPSPSTQISNTVLITGDGGLSDSSSTTTDVNASPALVATKADAPVTGGSVEPGENILYTVTIDNTAGTTPATGVIFSDTPGANTTLVATTVTTTGGLVTTGNNIGDTDVLVDVGTIAAGSSVVITFEAVVVNPLPAATTEVENQGIVASTELPDIPTDDPDTGTADDPTATPVNAAPIITVTKTDSIALTGGVGAGSVLTYTIAVNNIGDQVAANVGLVDPVPANTTLVLNSVTAPVGSTVNSGNATTDTTVDINLADLAVGTHTVTFQVRVDDPVVAGVETVANQATVRADGIPADVVSDDPETGATDDSTVTNVLATPDLRVSKSDGAVSATPGTIVTYTVNYSNVGHQTATNVAITETVPVGSTFVEASSDPNWSCIDGDPGGTVCTLDIASMPADGPASSGTLAFTVAVLAAFPAGQTELNNDVSITDDGTNGVDPTPSNNTGTDTTPVTASPDVSATKTAIAGPVAPGTTVSYTIEVRNDGNQNDSNVVFTDTPDANSALVVGSVTVAPAAAGAVDVGNTAGDTTIQVDLTTLLAGDVVTVTFDVVVDNPFPNGVTEISNQGFVDSDDLGSPLPTDDPSVNPDLDDPTVTAVNAAPIITALKVDSSSDDPVVPGSTINYTVTVRNSGTSSATNVEFIDVPDANTELTVGSVIVGPATAGSVTTGNTLGDTSVAVDLGTVTVGETITITFSVLVDDPIASGVTAISNQGTVTSTEVPDVDTDDPALTPGTSDPTVTPIVAAPILTLTKDDSLLAPTTPGATITYTLSLDNTGNTAATDVVVSDLAPAGTTFVEQSATTDVGTIDQGNDAGEITVSVDIASLAAGATATITFQVDVNDPVSAGREQLSNTASTVSTELGPITSTDLIDGGPTITPLSASPVLTVTKTDSADPVDPGADITYSIDYSNTGDQIATGVVLSETVPANTTYTSVGSSAWSCAPDNTAGSTCTLTLGTLAPGAANAGTATFVATVAPTLPSTSTQIANTVSITGDGGLNDSASTTTDVNAAPAVSATKVDAPVTAPDVNPGENILYTVVISNNGSAPATSIVFTDTPGARTTLAATTVATSQGSVTTGNTSGDTEIVVDVGTIVVGASVTITYQATVADPYPTTVGVSNQGAVTGDDSVSVPTDDPASAGTTDPTPTPIVITPELTVTKSDAFSAPLTPGDSITYTIVVANIGDGPAIGVAFTDDLATMSTLDLAGSVTTTRGTIDAGNTGGDLVSVDVGTVPAGDSVTITFVVTVVNPMPSGVSTATNQGTVDSTNAGTGIPTDDPATVTTDDPTLSPVTAAPDLTVAKDDGGVSTSWGGAVVYTITYRNVGSQDATGVVLTETVPDNATFTLTGSTTGWSCTPDNSAESTCTLDVGSVRASAPSATATFAVVTDNPVAAGQTQLANTVSIADDGANGADETPGDNAAVDTTPILTAPDLRIDKMGPTTVEPGDDITFTLDYANVGQTTALISELTETVPVGTTFDATASDSNWTCSDGDPAGTTCTLDLGAVAGAASGSIDFAVTVLEPAATTLSSIDNSAAIANNDPTFPNDPTPLDNTDAATVTLSAGSIGDRIWIDADEQGDQDASEAGTAVGTVVNLSLQGSSTVFAATTTGADGRYTFGGLSSGDYTVTVVPPAGYSAFNGDTLNVTLAAGGAVDDADIPINARAEIRGQVWTDANGDGIQQLTETTGPAGVTLNLLDATGAQVPDGNGGFITTTTGASGGYSFPFLLAGTYQIEIDESTLSTGYELTTPGNSGGVAVDPGEVISDLDFGVNALGAIAGHVFVDADENAVQGAGETHGLGGLTIALLDGAGSPVPDGSGGFVTTTTGADGSYSFDDLLAGTYQTEVSSALPPGFTATTPVNSADVVVTVGEDVADVDFGVNRRGSIGDLVWYDLDGDGTQNSTEPGLGGVTVNLLDGTGAPISDGFGGFVTTVTLPDGSYVLVDLLPDDYQISIEPGDLPVNASVTTPGLQPISVSVPAATSATSTVDIDTADFGVRGNSSIGDTIYFDLNADGVQQAGETTGIPDVIVELVQNGAVIATATTGATGNYSFARLLAGDYEVRVASASVPTGGLVTSSNPLLILGAADIVLDADIGVAGNGSIGDTVYLDVNEDGAQSGVLEVGQAGIELVLIDAAGREIARTTSSTAGNYIFDNVLPGSYSVEVVPETLPSADHGVTTTNPLPVIVDDGEDVVTADIGINALGSIAGLVFFDTDTDGINDAGEQGQTGVDVVLFDAAGDEVARVSVDPHGTYLFPNITAGDYTVRLDPTTLPDGAVLTTPANAGVAVGIGTNVTAADIGVVTPGTVTGLVFFDTDGDGVNDAGEPGVGDVTVRLLDGDGNVVNEAVVDADGSYEFSALPGVYTVEVGPDTLPPGTQLTTPMDARVDITPSGVAGPDFGITGSGSIGDTVFIDMNGNGIQDPNEQGLEGVTLILLDSDGTTIATVVTEPGGSYRFNGLLPGTHTVRIDVTTLQPGLTIRGSADFPVALAPSSTDLSIDVPVTPSITSMIPSTGADSLELGQTALAFLIIGAFLLFVATRRRRGESPTMT